MLALPVLAGPKDDVVVYVLGCMVWEEFKGWLVEFKYACRFNRDLCDYQKIILGLVFYNG